MLSQVLAEEKKSIVNNQTQSAFLFGNVKKIAISLSHSKLLAMAKTTLPFLVSAFVIIGRGSDSHHPQVAWSLFTRSNSDACINGNFGSGFVNDMSSWQNNAMKYIDILSPLSNAALLLLISTIVNSYVKAAKIKKSNNKNRNKESSTSFNPLKYVALTGPAIGHTWHDVKRFLRTLTAEQIAGVVALILGNAITRFPVHSAVHTGYDLHLSVAGRLAIQSEGINNWITKILDDMRQRQLRFVGETAEIENGVYTSAAFEILKCINTFLLGMLIVNATENCGISGMLFGILAGMIILFISQFTEKMTEAVKSCYHERRRSQNFTLFDTEEQLVRGNNQLVKNDQDGKNSKSGYQSY